MIDVAEMSYRYPGAEGDALEKISFRVEPGEIFGLVGPSGAGKSTVQKLLIGLLSGYRGSICLMGQEVSAWGVRRFEQIGVSFELPNHFLKLTGLENLTYFAALYKSKALSPSAALALVGLEEHGDQRVCNYSKGMKQRLSLARALLHGPSLLFLDEPTSGLDPVNAALVREVINEERSMGCTVVITSHNMELVEQLCDRLAFVVDGRLVMVDSPKGMQQRFHTRRVAVECDQQSEIFAMEGLAHNQRFLELIGRLDCTAIHSQEWSLDRIFREVTGRSLERCG